MELKQEMLWNGNELVFSSAPGVGVAGIAPGQPDELGEQIADAWNRRAPSPVAQAEATVVKMAMARYVAMEAHDLQRFLNYTTNLRSACVALAKARGEA